MINSKEGKEKPRINMTTEGLSRKQVIIPVSSNHADLIIGQANGHVISINSFLKEANSIILVDFIWADNRSIVITTNKIVNNSDLLIIEKYFKIIDSTNINSLWLPQSKSYLKILKFPYIADKTILPINSDIIKAILKKMLLFDNIILALKLWIIKVSPKSDMTIVWINIWDSQNGSKAKNIIKLQFNVSWYIYIVQSTNINLRVLQCKNCWWWGYSTFACQSHMARCIKYNSSHKTEHHQEIGWCCKENKKTTPLRSATKESNPCSYVFKCINCKGDHLANNYHYPYWKNHFNRDWHSKKVEELHKKRVTSFSLV